MTVYTDVSYEEAVAIIGAAPDDWTPDVMVPASGGSAFLY